MATGILLRPVWCPVSRRPPTLCRLPASITASSSVQGSNSVYRGPQPKRELVADWVSKNDDTARRLPIVVGGVSLLAVLLNRVVSGIAPVADASSSQSRTDILTLGLAVANILNGLVWLSIRPKYVSPVIPQGLECERISAEVPESVVPELLWFWESLSEVTCCKSLVIVYHKICLLQIGIAAESSTKIGEPVVVDSIQLLQGSLCQTVTKSQTQTYLANLSLYPGKSELPFLPSNTQSAILQPIGETGVAVMGGDTIRGFTSGDQAQVKWLFQDNPTNFSRQSKSVAK